VPHGRKTPKLSRTASHRDAMLANMAASLFLHSKVKTTTPRAKALRPFVDRLISIAKQGSLHSKRQVASVVTDKEALKKLFQEIVPKFQERNSGYSRVVKAGFRRGDAAEVSVVELLIEKPKAEKEAAEKKEGRLKKLSSKLKRGGKAEAAPAAPAAKKSGGKAKAAKATAPVEEPETEPEETTIEDSDAGEEKDKS
jgi:large subunit ribosomal protein L17